MSEKKPHILILDDDPDLLELMSMILEEEEKYQVTTQEIVFENIEDVERFQPDLILLDVHMQGRETTGTFLQQLKLHRSTKDIPVIICTAGRSEVREQEALLAQKGIPILYKPFDIDEFLQVVQQSLFSSRLGAT